MRLNFSARKQLASINLDPKSSNICLERKPLSFSEIVGFVINKLAGAGFSNYIRECVNTIYRESSVHKTTEKETRAITPWHTYILTQIHIDVCVSIMII